MGRPLVAVPAVLHSFRLHCMLHVERLQLAAKQGGSIRTGHGPAMARGPMTPIEVHALHFHSSLPACLRARLLLQPPAKETGVARPRLPDRGVNPGSRGQGDRRIRLTAVAFLALCALTAEGGVRSRSLAERRAWASGSRGELGKADIKMLWREGGYSISPPTKPGVAAR